MIDWARVQYFLDGVPAVVWIGLVVVSGVLAAATWSSARRRIRRAGQLAARAKPGSTEEPARDSTLLTVATMVPAVLFFVMVLAGSFHGLVAFGRYVLGWSEGWEFLVPGTLDGVSLAFAMLAFRAVRKGNPPDRCYRVVWIAAAASATINFAWEYGQSGNVLAGGYVGLLSLFAMIMFEELLSQFEEGARTVRRDNPKFGIRWATWPSNTFLAAVAWRNHPPAEGTAGTVLNAVANLDRVRAKKRAARRRERSGHVTAETTQPESMLAAAQPVAWAAAAVTDDPGLPAPRARPSSRVPDGREPRAKPAPVKSSRGPHAEEQDVRVPATVATVTQWVSTWIAVCADPTAAAGAFNDDEQALARFGVRARQLRNIRFAATSGALRRRAEELGATVPAAYLDDVVQTPTAGNPDGAA